MKGFEIQINGGAPIVIAAEHYAFALLGCVNGEEQGRLTLMGGNLTERFTWWNGALENGDKIRVRVVETECLLFQSSSGNVVGKIYTNVTKN